MKILFAFVREALQPESLACMEAAKAAGHDVHFHENHGVYDYWQAMQSMFREGEAFLNMEHDNTLSLEQIAEIAECNKPLCAFAYPMQHEGDILPALQAWNTASAAGRHVAAVEVLSGVIGGRDCMALGATRFSQEIVDMVGPTIAQADPEEWKWVEPGIFRHIPKAYRGFHQHYPNAGHIGRYLKDLTGLPAHSLSPHMRDGARWRVPAPKVAHNCNQGHPCSCGLGFSHGCSMDSIVDGAHV